MNQLNCIVDSNILLEDDKVASSKKPSIVKNNLDPVHVEDLAKSGITKKVAIANGLKSITEFPAIQFHLKNSGIPIRDKDVKSLLQFPYRSLNGRQLKPRCKVFPPLTYEDENNKQVIMKYLQAKGEDNHLYLPKDVDSKANTPIWITEGEKKALCLTANGFPAISVSGVWNWKKKGGRAIPDFDLVNWKGREVSLVFDSDKANNSHVRMAEQYLADELTERGANVIIINLPYGKDEVKGVDDFIVKYGKDEFKQVHKEVYKKITLKESLDSYVMTFSKFSDLEISPRKKLVTGAIQISESEIVLLVGDVGAGKTWFCHEIAKIASGGVRGLADSCHSNDVCKTMIIDGEMPLDLLKRNSDCLELDDIPHLTILSTTLLERDDVTPDLDLTKSEVRDMLTDYLLENNYRLVILDNLYSLCPGLDHRSELEYSPINAWAKKLRSKEISVILVHHPNKSGLQFGTHAKTFNIDSAIYLKKAIPSNGDDDCTCFTLQIDKKRSSGWDVAGKKYICKDGIWSIEGDDENELYNIAIGLEAKKSFDVIAKELKIDKSTVNRKKDKLCKLKYLEKDGTKFRLTKLGREWADNFMVEIVS